MTDENDVEGYNYRTKRVCPRKQLKPKSLGGCGFGEMRNNVNLLKLAMFVMVLTLGHFVFGQSIPSNAHKISWGKGWECDKGYYWNGHECVKVVVPENAHLDYSGHGWDCDKGYRKIGQQCVKIIIPENASLNYYGTDWICDRGFRRVGQECVEINIPENASLNYYGTDWECDPGFKRVGRECVEIIIPPNAELNYFGNGWVCSDGFVKRGERCIPINEATDDEVRDLMILLSIATYGGNCPCPYNTDSAGRRCGGRSAYSRAGGVSPLCYRSDISDKMVARFRGQYE